MFCVRLFSHNSSLGSDFLLMESEKVINGPTQRLSAPILTAGATSQSNMLQFKLSDEDFRGVKAKGIGVSTNTTWLIIGPATVYDMVGLPAVEIVESGITGGQSMQVRDITFDMTAPGLSKWRLDKQLKELYLFFTEPIVIKDQKGFKLSNGTGEVHLENCSTVVNEELTEATINLGSSSFDSGLNATVHMWEVS